MTRRQFAASAVSLPAVMLGALTRPLGVQVYTVRSLMAEKGEALAARFAESSHELERHFDSHSRELVERAEAVRTTIAETLASAETSLEERAEVALRKWAEASAAAAVDRHPHMAYPERQRRI